MPSLRLLCLNARTVELDRAGMARLIEELGADVACVHGAPSLLRWRSISASLARQAGLVVVGGGRVGGGNLLMSGLGVDVVTTRDRVFAGGRNPRRPGAALAVLRLLGTDFAVAGARFTGDRPTRARQAAELERAIDGLVPDDPPAVISVDTAERSDSAQFMPTLSASRTAVAGGVLVDGRITVADAAEMSAGTVRLDLVLG